MTAFILQDQLAPIVGTLDEDARLLDLHAALDLLNHSTARDKSLQRRQDHDIHDFLNNIKQWYNRSPLPNCCAHIFVTSAPDIR